MIVGDSQGHSLAVNLPEGIGNTFEISDGSLDGCSVYDSGSVRSSRAGFGNSFAMCAGWQDEWAGAVRDVDAEVALVVLGAWDVFDLETGDGDVLTFGTAEWDDYMPRAAAVGRRCAGRRRRPGRAARGAVHASAGRRGRRRPRAA